MKSPILLPIVLLAISCSATAACPDNPESNGQLRHYDSQGRQIGKSVRQGNEIKCYDSIGRLEGKKVIANGEIRSFDVQGRLIGISRK